MTNQNLRAAIAFGLVLCFSVLLLGGYWIRRDKPPVPAAVKDPTGRVIFTGDDIMAGQNYYFSRGGQHMGTIWGHGSYVAPDWSADYLHRLGLYLAARKLGQDPARAASFTQTDLDRLDAVERARVSAEVAREIKQNRYRAADGALEYTALEAEAFPVLAAYYTALFKNGEGRMALQPGIVRTDEEGRLLTSFFAWLAWAAGANRPGLDYTYTSNWPYDPLVGNQPLPGMVIWSIVSVILLILAIAVTIFVYLRYLREGDEAKLVLDFPEPAPTPSQKAVLPYFLVAIAMLLMQAGMGAITGHYIVESNSFFGLPLAKVLPFAASRSWHLQLGVFFIATCFLAAGLFIGPLVGREPAGQKTLVIALFAAVVVVVVGSLGGTWVSVLWGAFGKEAFYFGHQGYEYVELGRVWQVLLIAGMLGWLVLVARAIRPALAAEKDYGGLTHLLLYSAVSIPLFYMAGLMYGKGSHLSDAEYWRWWVVHLWVEGFFEVFATVVMAFLLTRLGAMSRRFALVLIYLSISLYLGSGVIGTFHHLYWAGTPLPIIALGAVFSALEVVPLSLMGFEIARHQRTIAEAGPAYAFKWPIYFFMSVAFWNLVGAGVFGFLINPPIVLYYSQGINTTPIHSHTALFGVYGLLAISLMLFSVRHIVTRASWSDRLLAWSFWGLNGGLAGMTVFSLVPSGFYQLYYAVKYGIWFARSPEITTGPVIRTLNYLRIAPDLVFMTGAALLLLFLARAIYLSFWLKPRTG